MAPESPSLEIRFDYLPASPLANGWNIAYGADAEFSSANKPKWLVMRTHGQKFAIDYSIPSQAQEAYRIVFDAEFRTEAIFYAEVEMHVGNVIENWWFAFVRSTQRGSPSKASANELKFPIAPTDGKARFDINVRQCAAEGLPGKVFGRIKRIRVRGDFNLSRLLLLQHDLAIGQTQKRSTADQIGRAGLVIAVATFVVAPFNEDVRHFAKEQYHRLFSAKAHSDEPDGTATHTSPPAHKAPQPLTAEAGANASELRQRHGVRRLSEFESGKTTDEVPSGSYGFAHPSAFEYKRSGPIELFSSEGVFEVHKLRDGSVTVLGYVGTETYLHLQEGAQNGDSVSFYSGPFKAFSHLMSIPINRIECNRVRPVASLRVADCKVVGH